MKNTEPTTDLWSIFYKDGFFGYGEPGNFKNFSIWHFLPIILLIVAIILTYTFREKIKNFKYEKSIRFFLGCLMLLVEMSYFWRLLYIGSTDNGHTDLLSRLPFQICEWTCIFAALMVLTDNKHLFDIVIMVSLTVGLLPLAMPQVISRTGPTYYRYYQYWLEHILPIYAIFYMMFIKGYKYDIKKVYKAFSFLFVLAIICIILNYNIPNGTYMYLQGDALGSAFKWLPSNQFARLGIFSVVVSILFGLEYLVFYLVNKFKNKRLENIEENVNIEE